MTEFTCGVFSFLPSTAKQTAAVFVGQILSRKLETSPPAWIWMAAGGEECYWTLLHNFCVGIGALKLHIWLLMWQIRKFTVGQRHSSDREVVGVLACGRQGWWRLNTKGIKWSFRQLNAPIYDSNSRNDCLCIICSFTYWQPLLLRTEYSLA